MADLHDGIFRLSFSNKRAVAEFSKLTFPRKILAKVNLATLKPEEATYLDSKLKKYYADIVYSCQTNANEKVYLNFVFEHKSYLPENPELQLLLYLALGYTQQKRIQKLQKQNKPLTQIIPVLLYHGTASYTAKHLYEYIEPQDEDLRGYVPQFDHILINLADFSDEEIMAIEFSFFLRSVLMLFKHKGDKEYVKQNSEKIFIFVEKEELDKEQTELCVQQLFFYIVKTYDMNIQEIDEVIENVSEQSRKTVMTGYQRLINKGKIEGIEIGIERGAEFNELKKNIEIILEGDSQNLPIESIVFLSGQSKKFIHKLQAAFADGNEKKARKVLYNIFKDFKELKKVEIAQLEGLLKEFLPKKR